MSDWGGGYVTDVEYPRHYYLAQSPHLIAVACVMNGVAVDMPWQVPRLHYLELGCGRGVNACVLAAANPGWQVTGIDFTPAAIADARRFARDAGLGNVTFIEADLADFAETAEAASLAPADVASMHGVWSWVADRVRAGIVRLLAAKVRAGGMVHVSYNAMPAHQGMLGMQRLLRETGRRLGGRSDQQIAAALEVVRQLADAEARQLGSTPLAREMLGLLPDMPVAYLAHEYMNTDWRPCFHGDVAGALAAAKLDYAGSARLQENFVDLMLTPAQRMVYDRSDDPLMRELVMDTCINRTLRHDIYVRGTARLSPEARDAILGEVPLVLATLPESFVYTLDAPAGEAAMNRDYYAPMVEALAAGPRRVAELLALPTGREHHRNPGEVVMTLAGNYRALVAPWPDEVADARLRRFNAVVARRDVHLGALTRPSVLASLCLGAGYPCRAVEAFLVDRIGAAGGAIDPAVMATELAPSLPAEEHARLVALLTDVLGERLAVWQRLGLV